MAYRTTTVRTVVADDSTREQVDYDRSATIYQSQDLQVFHTVKRVLSTDTEAQVSIAPVTTGYFIQIASDYPVMVRLNGNTATQFTLTSNSVSPVNLGAPLPDQCIWVATTKVTSLYIAPVVGAANTATVRIVVTGDPATAY